MGDTSYLLLRSTAARMRYQLDQRIENEWMTGDERDHVMAKRDRLARFEEYIRLQKEFSP